MSICIAAATVEGLSAAVFSHFGAEANPTDPGLLGSNPRSETQRSVAAGDRQSLGISRSAAMRYVKLDKPPVYSEGSLEDGKERRLTESLVSSP